MAEKNFGYLGFDFQQKLIKTIIEDKKYAERIIDIIESKFFENSSFKFIMENIKEFYDKFERVPDYVTLSQKILNENGNNSSCAIHLDTLEILKSSEHNTDYVQETALNFCRQQNLKKVLKSVDKIIEGGEFEKYDEIENLIVNALQVGVDDNEPSDVFDNLEDALEKNYRHPIPTGIVGIDNLLKGGLGRGELAVVLAPTGVGKSTVLTKISNTAYNLDYNVLQIFFEDNLGDIKRKHYTIWTGIPSDDQPDNKKEVIEKVQSIKNKSKGSLKLMKLASSEVTISQIKSIVRKNIADGFKIDLLVIDYVDCIQPEKSNNGDEWKGEGSIMRRLDAMANEFDIAIWTATQGGRDSISSDVVNTDQMGGSIKKAQIAHVIVSIAKTLEQKEHNLATIALLKSRIGKDGIVFENCRFNNELIIIDTESQNTLLGVEEQKVQDRQERAKAAFLKRQEMTNKN